MGKLCIDLRQMSNQALECHVLNRHALQPAPWLVGQNKHGVRMYTWDRRCPCGMIRHDYIDPITLDVDQSSRWYDDTEADFYRCSFPVTSRDYREESLRRSLEAQGMKVGKDGYPARRKGKAQPAPEFSDAS